jgi:O-antigen/teichoic acid export membrane protein
MRSLKYTYAEMLAARILAVAGSFGVAILTARMLGPVDRGRYYYIITLAAVGMQFASLGIHASNTYLVARTPSLLPQIMSNTVWIALLGGGLAAFGALIFDAASGGASHDVTFTLTLIVLTPSTLLFMYLTNLVVALNRPSTYNGLIIFGSLASIVLALAAALFSPKLATFLWAAVAGSVGASIVAWQILAKGVQVPRLFDSELFFAGIAYALKAHIATLLGFLMSRLGILIIRQFGNFGDVGQWSIAIQISDAIMILPATISLLLFPSLVRADEANRNREFKRTLVRLSGIMALLCLVASVLIQPVLLFIFGVVYAPAVAIVHALLPGVFFLSVASVASQFLSAQGYPWSQVLAWVCGAVLQATFSLVLFDRIGVVGLAWIQSCCATFVCIWLLLKCLTYVRRKPSGLADPIAPTVDP